MSGKACCASTKLASCRPGSPAGASASSALERFEPEQIHARWTASFDRSSTDPAGAITRNEVAGLSCALTIDDAASRHFHNGTTFTWSRRVDQLHANPIRPGIMSAPAQCSANVYTGQSADRSDHGTTILQEPWRRPFKDALPLPPLPSLPF